MIAKNISQCKIASERKCKEKKRSYAVINAHKKGNEQGINVRIKKSVICCKNK